jgi:hypothetical protein
MPSKAATPAKQRQTTRDLTPAEFGLVEIMRHHRFGRIENLRIVAGQPVLRSDTRIVHVARINGTADELGLSLRDEDEFELKAAVWDLIGKLETLNNGVILRLEFRNGLPCLLETEAEVGRLQPRR